MKKFIRLLVALIIVAVVVLFATGTWSVDMFDLSNNTAADEKTLPVAQPTQNADDEEVTEEDLKMIEDFLDDIVQAVEKEETK